MKKLLFLILIFWSSTGFSQGLLPYKDATLSAAERAQDLVKRMTPEEKFWQMFMIPDDLDEKTGDMFKNGIFGLQVGAGAKGDAAGKMLDYDVTENALQFVRKLNDIQHFFMEETRLGIPVIFFEEALHGLVRSEATVFPQAIGLAATFDTSLMREVSETIAAQAKSRGIRQVLSPVINIANDVRWGRTEETYGEDPFLSSLMAVSFIKSFEDNGIITTPKHFVANVGAGGRDSYPIHDNKRFLEEVHFPPFKAAFNKGGARSVMTSYNSVDGTSSSSNSWLLEKKLKGEWGFDGFVISDANAVGGDAVLLHTAKDYNEAGRNAVNNGMDVIFQTEYDHAKLFMEAFLDGSIDTNRINDAVFRVLKAKFDLGLFDHPFISESDVIEVTRSERGRELALKSAEKSIVLLKNDGVLPLKQDVKKIAIIGRDAATPRLGGYSGSDRNAVSILDGIKNEAHNKSLEIQYSPGVPIVNKKYAVVENQYLTDLNGASGLTGSYFNNIDLKGTPIAQKTDKNIDFLWTLARPDKSIKDNFYAIKWEGKIHSPKTGNFKIGIEGNDGFRLYIDDHLLIDNWKKIRYSTLLSDFHFDKDKEYDIKVEFFEPVGNAKLKLVWNATIENEWEKQISDAVAAANQSDVAVVVAGIHEGEFQDRGFLSLPGHQEELINAVASIGKPVIVVLIGGSAITMTNWLPNVSAVLDAWYPGERGGDAVANVLFGHYNPSGRLPITFAMSEGQLPLVYNHKPTGRGDDYYDLSGLPQFPFGYGMSYTTFEYSDLKFGKNTIGVDENTKVSFKIKNSGDRDGEEVVQLYIRDIVSSVTQPVIQLKGINRIHLAAGETKEVEFTITPDMLSMLDKDMDRIVEPGAFYIMIGASSRDIRLKQSLLVE